MSLILIAEDEKRIRTIIGQYLSDAGYDVLLAEDGNQALTLFSRQPDLIILDVMMPGIDGFSLCELMRRNSDAPLIFLTARHSEPDKLKGYEMGADDYITKPFSPKVLTAKVAALLRRTGRNQGIKTLSAGHITLYPMQHEVYVGEERVELTHKEYELLFLFLQNQKQVFSREQLLNRIWGFDFAGNTRTVDAHIKTLRQKLGKEGRHIITLIRSGYKFEVNDYV